MNQFAVNNLLKKQHPSCTELMKMAEQELAAFFRAVAELFGPEQAKISAEDWLQELKAVNDLPTQDLAASIRQWRSLTVKAAARLAGRVNVSSISFAS